MGVVEGSTVFRPFTHKSRLKLATPKHVMLNWVYDDIDIVDDYFASINLIGVILIFGTN
jgi:hypothetical protein